MSETAAMPQKKKILGVFTLAMINVAAVLSIRNFPSMAEYGWSSIGWYIIGTILFLIPISLAGAELATGWPEGGGIYAWVKRAFGDKGGFTAIFCEWSNNLVWFPTVLAFIASTLAFALTPTLASNSLYMFTVMMAAFWGTTLIALSDPELTNKFSNVGVVLGGIIPAVLIIALGMIWIIDGSKTVIPPFSLGAIVPTITLSTLPFFATIVLLFSGMEMAGFHALETKNPQRDYPRAMALSAIIIFLCTVFATLAIAFVIPASKLNLASGVMQAIQFFFVSFGMPGLVAPMALLITVGGIVLLAAWLIGPGKGLGVVADDGNMPPIFNKTNKHGAPVAILIIQAVIGSVISLLYVFLPSVNAAYWLLSAITTELLAIVYLLVFAALIQSPVQPAGYATTVQNPRRHGWYLDCRGTWRIRGYFHVYRRTDAPLIFLERAGLRSICTGRHIPPGRSSAGLFKVQEGFVESFATSELKKRSSFL